MWNNTKYLGPKEIRMKNQNEKSTENTEISRIPNSQN